MKYKKLLLALFLSASPVWPESQLLLTPGPGKVLESPVPSDKSVIIKPPKIALPEWKSTSPSAFPGKNSSAPPLVVPTVITTRATKKERAAKEPGITQEDYFPMAPGSKVTYEYLAPTPGERIKKTRLVECLECRRMGGQAVLGKYNIIEGLSKVPQKIILYATKAAQTSNEKKKKAEACFIKLPKKGHWTRWKNKMKGGILQSCKAIFGKTKIGRRNYPDCVLVVEKDYKKGKLISTVRRYYAKGIGLILSGFYDPNGKLIRSKSYAYIKTEGIGKSAPLFRNP